MKPLVAYQDATDVWKGIPQKLPPVYLITHHFMDEIQARPHDYVPESEMPTQIAYWSDRHSWIIIFDGWSLTTPQGFVGSYVAWSAPHRLLRQENPDLTGPLDLTDPLTQQVIVTTTLILAAAHTPKARLIPGNSLNFSLKGERQPPHLASVKVVTLRATNLKYTENGIAIVDWNHRWRVREHFRHLSGGRITTVHSHIKGPPNKPFIEQPRLYHVKHP